MLPKKYRINTKTLKEIFQKGKKKHFPDLVIYYQDNVYSYPRITVVVPKKISKKSVLRNKIKRRIRHALFLLIKENKIPPKDYIFMIKSINLKDEQFDKIKDKLQQYINEISN